MVELLAPAGDWESLRAAVANGADAVYFGLDRFNARARAANFTVEELPEVLSFLHTRNAKGFVALNTLIFANEIEDAISLIEAIAIAGADAVIVQDLGLAKLIKHLAPTLAVHGSTQMTLTNSRGIEFVKNIGVERVVLARELSLDEIRSITQSTTMPVEVFVHGALCVAYSGQCLTSEALGGRSANRGQCAQACRLPYEMLVDGERRDLGDKAYLLSPQDLAAYDFIKPLIDAGVTSFKIEGRLKGGPYVAQATQTYRHAIDAALIDQPFHLNRREELDLAQTFSRGFTPGFLEGNNHQRLVRGRVPKSRGIRIGVVAGIEQGNSAIARRGIVIRYAEDFVGKLQEGDGLLFDLGKPETKEPGGRVWHAAHLDKRPGHCCVVLGPEFDDFSIVGCDVWKTDDPQLRKRLEQTYAQDKPARREVISATLSGDIGRPMTLTLCDASATWPGPLERAVKRATTHDEIREQLSRLGDTPFELGECRVDVPANVMIPKSVLNELRRQCVQQLKKKTTHSFSRDAIAWPSRTTIACRSEDPGLRLTVLCRTMTQLDTVLEVRPDAVYCDFEDLRQYRIAVEKAEERDIPIGLAPPRIWKPGEDGLQAIVARAKPNIILVRNLAQIGYFQEMCPEGQLVGDYSLNVANELTASLLVDSGLTRLTPSFDLNFDQFTALMQASDAGLFEVVVHQHMPMFHMEHCVFAAFLSTGRDHRDCGRPCDRHTVDLRDRVGAEFPVIPDTGCRNTVFNSVPQSGAEYIARMRELGVRHFRIDLLREEPHNVRTLIEHYSAVISGRDDGRTSWKKLKALNQLGVTRGTLQLA